MCRGAADHQPEMEAETAENIWRQTRCIDLLRGQKIIEIDAEASVAEGCEVRKGAGVSVGGAC